MAAPFIQANTNGRLHPAHEPSLSPLNRGFLYGDAVYEVWRTYDRVIFAWEEHWTRLRASARALQMEVPQSPEQILAEIRRTVAAFGAATAYDGELYIRLQIARGAGPIGLDTGLSTAPEFVLLVQPCPRLPADKAGLKLSIATGLRRNSTDTLSPAWKTGNYLNNILCLREARARGADEVLMLNLRGEVTEAAVSNIAFVRDRVIVTPPLTAGILSGITRHLVLREVAARAGLVAREETLQPSSLAAMQECFLLATTKDVQPVASIDDLRFAVGDETTAARLKRAFGDYAREYAAAHRELKV